MLYLIDGSGFIFRAFHALPLMTRPDGTHVNAVYGFCTMLNRVLAEIKSDKIAVIFDAGRKTFRNEIYPEYKAHRPPPPPELVPQFALIREATLAYGLPSVEAQNYEADDLIAAYAQAALAAHEPVRIISSDKDLMQLMRPGIELFDPLRFVPITEEDVQKKFGVTPDRVVDVQSLAGDSTDNVPGIPGIGVKTAAELINQYGTLENLLDHAHEIKQPKRRELLTQHADKARISKKLVQLDLDSPLPVPLDQLQRQADHQSELIEFLKAQDFRSLLARMKAPTESSSSAATIKPPSENTNVETSEIADDNLLDVSIKYELIQDIAALERWVAEIEKTGHTAIDTETDSLTACTATLVGISLAIAPGIACYIPVNHIDPQQNANSGELSFANTERPKQIALKDIVRILQPMLANPAILKIGHNLKYDMQVLNQHGLTIFGYDDTMLLSYALAAGAHGHGLDELCQLHFQHKTISFDEVTGTGKSRITFDRVPLDQALNYAAEDADYTLRLWLRLKPQIAQQHVTRVYERIERPLVPVVAKMEETGILIDPDILSKQSHGFAVRLQKLEEEIFVLAGQNFNVGSPKQMGEILFERLGLPGGTKSKTGAWSTSVDVLEPLAEAGHAIVEKILDWRGVSKLKSTYTDALPQQINPRTGRVHTSFSLVGAATGRLSSNDPNLQNIPIRTEDGRAIRRAFIAAPGCELLSVDYSQIELRLAAEMAGIKSLIQAFHDGVDIHALTASQIHGIPLSSVTPEQRRAAKAINFGIIYGISGFGLAKQIDVTPAEANAFIKNYLNGFPELRDFMENTKQFARAHGYVVTLFGRKVHVQGLNDKNGARRSGAERAAINAPLQGTAADIMKRAMIRIGPALEKAHLKAKLLLQVHDELVFEVPRAEIESTAELVKQVMQDAPLPAQKLQVPIIASAGHALNWAEAH